MLAITLLVAETAAQMPVQKVVVKQAKRLQAPATVTLVGTVYPNRVSRIGSEVEGLLDEMPVRQGDHVEAGGILCRLRSDSLRHQLAEATARLASLRARHEELLAGTRPEELARLEALRDEAAADFERWEFEMNRVKKLIESGEANPKEYHDTRGQFLAAQARMKAAQARYEEAVSGPRKETIARAAHDVAAQKAVVERLQSDLEKTVIRAPFAGYITQRLVEVGEWIESGDEVVEFAELATVLIRVNAPESAFPFLKVGQTVRVTVDALESSFDGTIKHIVPSADPTARTLPVEIEIDNDDGLMAAGMFARATVPSGPKRELVAVPKDSVVHKGGIDYLAAVRKGAEGKLNGRLVPVTLGADLDEWVAVTSGNVEPEMPVITLGSERMMPFPVPIEVVDEIGRPVAMPDGKDRRPAQDEAGGTEGV